MGVSRNTYIQMQRYYNFRQNIFFFQSSPIYVEICLQRPSFAASEIFHTRKNKKKQEEQQQQNTRIKYLRLHFAFTEMNRIVHTLHALLPRSFDILPVAHENSTRTAVHQGVVQY